MNGGCADKFLSAHCGKIYKSGSTEIVSMGIQRFSENAAIFFQKDPEYFNFILKIIKGEL
jgi:hypothetical protein